MKTNVTVWNEFRHEKTDEAVRKVYPDGMHNVIAAFLGNEEGFERAHGHAGRAGARPHRRRAGQHRRAGLVGAHGAP